MHQLMALRPEKGASAVNNRMTDAIKDKYGVKRYVLLIVIVHVIAYVIVYVIMYVVVYVTVYVLVNNTVINNDPRKRKWKHK
jgi:hypothetical protein